MKMKNKQWTCLPAGRFHRFFETGLHRFFLVFILSLFFFAAPVLAEDEMATTTPDTTVTSTPEITLPEAPSPAPSITVNVHVRYFDEVAYEGAVELVEFATTTITDSTGMVHVVTSTSALGAVQAADRVSDAFELTSLGFFSGVGLYIHCINLPVIPTNACNNWLYTVNDVSPWLSVDNYTLQTGDDIYIYFGQPYRISVSTSTVQVNQSFTALAEQYRYRSNEWQPRPNITVGATQPGIPTPENFFFPDPIVFVTSTSDALGMATLTITATGTYNVGVAEDYYYPTVPITVVEIPALAIPDAPEAPPAPAPSGNCCSPAVTSHQMINVDRAIQFLTHGDVQKTNGSILDSALYSDWTAMAFAAYAGNNPGKELLKQYLLSDPAATVGFNETADYARRAMALLALGINPYTGTPTNYIQKITDRLAVPDSEYNDDIFALFPLLHAGYTASDPLIVSTTAYILTKQEASGAWFGVDMTGAAVQALTQVRGLPGVADALEKAKEYLRSQQNDTGGFGNTDSTSWVVQGIAAFGEQETAWVKNNATPGDFLASKQIFEDGGIKNNADTPLSARVWSTAYAIPAALGKTWGSILTTVEKPTAPIPNSQPAPSSPPAVTPLIPPTTTTIPVVTSTEIIIIPSEPSLPSLPPEPLVIIRPSSLDRSQGTPPHGGGQPHQAVAGVQITATEEPVVTTTEVLVTTKMTAEETPITTEPAAVSTPTEEPRSSIPVVPVAAAGAIGVALYLGWKFFFRVV